VIFAFFRTVFFFFFFFFFFFIFWFFIFFDLFFFFKRGGEVAPAFTKTKRGPTGGGEQRGEGPDPSAQHLGVMGRLTFQNARSPSPIFRSGRGRGASLRVCS